MEISVRIRYVRMFRNYSLESMAFELNMSIEGYRKMENRSGRVAFDKLKAISGILGIPWKDLLDVSIPIQSLIPQEELEKILSSSMKPPKAKKQPR
jgi:transcriptional regulator with XRE-family HTH domain